MLEGLGSRTDAWITSVEVDAETAKLAAGVGWPDFVTIEHADALEVLARPRRWNLIFADAQGGKWEGLDGTICALTPRGSSSSTT